MRILPDYSDLIGIRFMHLGRETRRGGCTDCMGLFLEIHRRADHFALDPVDDPIAAEDQWEVILGPPWRSLDGLAFAPGENGLAEHIAVYLGGGRMLHAVERLGVIETTLGSMGPPMFAYRWKE